MSVSRIAKATLLNIQTGAQIAVHYNPEQYQVEQGNVLAEVPIPGLNATPVQFVRGKGRTLSMELLFDTYENHTDVRNATNQIVALLKVDPILGGPPIVLVTFGDFQFECVLTECNQRYTMFDRDGTPVRATLTVRFREFVRVQVTTQAGLLTGLSTLDSIQANQTLAAFAHETLGDASRWREIAVANGIVNPLAPPTGVPLRIPNKGARA